MKTKTLGIIICVLAGWFILSIAPNCLAASGGVLLRTQGLINPGGNLQAGYLVINEMRVHIDPVTQIMDQYGTSIPVTRLKPRGWVYIEIEKDPIEKITKAHKIVLLPRYVTPAEKKRFSFMR
jgi:hypothetical protein